MGSRLWAMGPRLGDVWSGGWTTSPRRQRGDGVGAVVGGWNPVPPVIPATTARQFDLGRIRMHILAFAVFKVANLSCLIASAHLLIIGTVGIVFSEHIDLAATLNSAS